MTKKYSGYYVVLIGSLFYCYEFFLRVSPSAITDILMHHFNVGAGGLSFISAAFFYAYMPMQVFAGLIGDKYGVKRVLLFCIALCCISTVIFSSSNNVLIAFFARFFMGVSASFAYVGPLILASIWLPARFYSASAGFIQVLGSLGAFLVSTEIGSKYLMQNWQQTYLFVAMIGLVLLILVSLFVKDKPILEPKTSANYKMMNSLRLLLSCSQTWWIALIGFAFWAPMSVFGELWGAKFLQESEGVNLLVAGSQMKWLWVGVALGGPFWGLISCYSRKFATNLAYLLCAVSSCLFIYLSFNNIIIMDILLFLFGFACAAQCLSFGYMRDFQNNTLIGAAVGFTNMFVILGGTLLQPLSGYLIDYFHQSDSFLISMKYTFVMLPIISLFGLFVANFKVKGKGC